MGRSAVPRRRGALLGWLLVFVGVLALLASLATPLTEQGGADIGPAAVSSSQGEGEATADGDGVDPVVPAAPPLGVSADDSSTPATATPEGEEGTQQQQQSSLDEEGTDTTPPPTDVEVESFPSFISSEDVTAEAAPLSRERTEEQSRPLHESIPGEGEEEEEGGLAVGSLPSTAEERGVTEEGLGSEGQPQSPSQPPPQQQQQQEQEQEAEEEEEERVTETGGEQPYRSVAADPPPELAEELFAEADVKPTPVKNPFGDEWQRTTTPGGSGGNEELRRFMDFVGRADRPSSRKELSESYYRAMESLYVHHNISEFAERAEQGVAESGHSRLHFLLGVLYANGLGVARSEGKAVLHYTFAAIQGVAEAHVALGHRHRYGLGVPQGCAAAAMHLREAADAIAVTYSGHINPRPLEKQSQPWRGELGFSYGPRGDEGSDTSSLTERDTAKRMKADRAKAVDAMRFRIEQGSAEAALRLGVSYLHGTLGMQRDTRLAEQYFLRAIKMSEEAHRKPLGDAYAYLGQIYAAGDAQARPTPLLVDLEKAVEYFRKGAAANSGLALNGLGYLHAIGYLSHDKTPNERRGSERMDSGPELSSGADRSPDFESSALYFQRAIQLSRNAEAMHNLGVLHLHGRGVPTDASRAKLLFEDSATLGSMLSLWQLGRLAEARGDCRQAVDYYILVAKYGSWHDRGVSINSDVLLEDEGAMVDEGDGGAAGALEAKGKAGAPRGEGEPEEPAPHGKLLTPWRRWLTQTGEGRGGESGPRSFLRAPGSEPAIAQLLEQLALAETGSVAAAREAAVLLDEDLFVADEGEDVETLVLEGAVEAGNPSFAHGNKLPKYVMESANAETVVLQWQLPTTVLLSRDDGSGHHHEASYALPWLVSQREAKLLLLLRLLYLSAGKSTKSCLRLGDFFYYGESSLVGSDAAVALHYYKEATRDNTAQAYFNVGLMHQLGIGVPPLRFTPDGSADASTAGRAAQGKGRVAGAAGVLSSGPSMRPWVPGLAPSGALARRHRDQAAVDAPNYVLLALLRVLESTVHNRAPLSRIWRYERGEGADSAYPAVDFVAAVVPSVKARDGWKGATSSDRHHCYYDLNLAKRAYDNCLQYSHGKAYYAVRLALIFLNLQWWALHHCHGILKGMVTYAAAQLAATEEEMDALTPAPSLGRVLRLANALLQGALSHTFSTLSSGANDTNRPAKTLSRPPAYDGDVFGGREANAAAPSPSVWAMAGAWYVTLETYLLFFLCGVLFLVMVLQHHAV